MKKFKYLMMILAAFFIFGNVANAATVTNSFVTDDNGYKEVEYIKNYPVIVKTTDNGKTYVYCMNMSKPLEEGADILTYQSGATYNKVGKADDGYLYILRNKPSTTDKDRDFYITQMAVWYYADILNGDKMDSSRDHTEANLPAVVKAYVDLHADSEYVSKYIYQLVKNATQYSAPTRKLKITSKDVTFTKTSDYYVSSEIIIDYQNAGNIDCELANAPNGSIIERSSKGVIVKVPVSAVTKEISFTVNVSGNKEAEKAIFYSSKEIAHGRNLQNLLYSEIESTELKDSISVKENLHEVKISKTDITQSNEVPGATLIVKDANGNVVDTWVSTNETHYLNLLHGKYSLTETIAPKGYKLSSTTIEFLVDENGKISVKVNGVYESVDKINFINELIDSVTINKIDKDTKEFVVGATLVIKDKNGNVVKEFTTTDTAYSIELENGYYTLSEVSAPNGYVLSEEVVYFYLDEDGTLKIKNESGEYVESAAITFVNTKKVEKEVIVPATGLNSYTVLIGVLLLASGIICVKKYSKEC